LVANLAAGQHERTADALADAIELRLLQLPSGSMGNPSIRAYLAETAAAAAPDADLAIRAMERRQALLGEALYPFVVGKVGIRARVDSSAHLPYVTTLLLSRPRAAFRAKTRTLARAGIIFECLVAAAMPSLLGERTEVVRFAWPSDIGRPRDFPAAIRWLSIRMGIPLGTAYRPPRRQDGGVDIVAWRAFGDDQPGFPILLAQVTLGLDYVQKSADIDLRVWAGWLGFDADPATALAIPFTVSRTEEWREMAQRTLVLDRLRLCILLAGVDTEAHAAAEWTAAELERLRATT